MLIAHLEPQVASVGLEYRNVEIGVLQIECHYPVAWIQGRWNLSQREHYELVLSEKEV